VRTPLQAPNANSHAERFVLSIKRECLDYLLVFGINRLERIIEDYILYFNKHRPHQGIGNRIPADTAGAAVGQPFGHCRIECRRFLGGLLKSYHNAA
jgi:putative transposase